MKKAVRVVLIVVAAVVVLVGGFVGYIELKYKTAPEVRVRSLDGHCDDPVVLTGVVTRIENPRTYKIRDAFEDAPDPAEMIIHRRVRPNGPQQPEPVLGKLARVRGTVGCVKGSAVNMFESELSIPRTAVSRPCSLGRIRKAVDSGPS